MGFRNHVFRTMLLLGLALGVGIAVGIFSGSERTRPLQDSGLPVVEHQADRRLAKPLIRPAPAAACAAHGGCSQL
jgi:hypothetical protein